MGFLVGSNKSTDYGGYFSKWSDADEACTRIDAYHKKKIEDLGDIFEKPKITIYKVSYLPV